MRAVTVIKDPHSPTSVSSKSCHNMMKKGLESSYLPTKEMNKSKIKINNMKNERVSNSKATTIISTAASKKHCLCAPTTHPGSFKCRLHRAAPTTTSHIRIDSSSARHVNGVNCKILNFTKLVAPSQNGGARNSNKANVHGQHGLSRFGRAVLAAAAGAQVQTISAALRQMSLN